MKKKIMLFSSIILISFGLFLPLQLPTTFLKNVNPADIATITVRDGSTGETFTITDANDISYITATIQNAQFEKAKISLFYVGTLYTIHFYDENAAEIEHFILNSDSTIRRDPFFYHTDTPLEGLCEYIKNLAPPKI